ncbi:hypothetical protein H5410_014451, partial [Solanum commersonii]
SKNEESKRPKSKYLEMKPYSSSSLQNPLKLRAKLSKSIIYVAMDPSTSLVGIADLIGDSPFGVVHHRFALAFSFAVLTA